MENQSPSLDAEYNDCVSYVGSFDYGRAPFDYKADAGRIDHTEAWQVARLRAGGDNTWEFVAYLSERYDNSSAARKEAKKQAEQLKLPFNPTAFVGKTIESGKASGEVPGLRDVCAQPECQ